MIIDACIFLGDSLYRNGTTPLQVLEKMQQNRIDRAIVRPFRPSDYNYDKANRYIAGVQDEYPQLIGFGRVNPLEKSAPVQVRRMKEYGLKGLHLHPWEDNFMINDPVVDPTVEAAGEAGFPVYVSTGYPFVSEPLQMWELAARHPEVTFIATHGGQLDMSGFSFDDALLAAKEAKNLKFDLSGVYRRDFIELLIDAAGEDNVLYGSCYPYMDISLELERIRAAQIPKERKERLFSENARELVG